MVVNFESQNIVWRLGILLHRVRDELVRCEEPIFSEYGLTTEQYSVLAAMKYICDPARITDIAKWLERRTNSVSMEDHMMRTVNSTYARWRRATPQCPQ